VVLSAEKYSMKPVFSFRVPFRFLYYQNHYVSMYSIIRNVTGQRERDRAGEVSGPAKYF